MTRIIEQSPRETAATAESYMVRLGHTVVHVRADNKDAAIAAARLVLSAEMPRLYDVIRGMATSRFQVEHAA